MSSVNITINGQEQRLTQLAQDFDDRIASMRTRFGEVGDARLTVMAAMMLGDELVDAKAKVARLEADVGSLTDARAGATDRLSRTEAAVVSALDSVSDRIERMTLALSRPSSGGMAVG
jgi:cell division protein ZapA